MKAREIPALTGLRGVAALCVLLDHFSQWTRPTPELPPGWLMHWLAVSGWGMTTFFTLSGYVIALSTDGWDWRSSPVRSFARLLLYRVARLYPAYLLFMVVVILRAPKLQDLSSSYVQQYIAVHFGLLQSWWPMTFDGRLPGAGYFHVSWSLSSEWGLYCLFGLSAMFAAAVAWSPLKIAAALIVALALVLTGVWLLGPPAGFPAGAWTPWVLTIWPPGLVLQFGLGVIAYRLRHLGGALWSNAGVVLFVGAYLLADSGLSSGIGISVAVALGVAFLLVGAESDSWINRLLSHPTMVHVGTVSYSLYLLHFLAAVSLVNGVYVTWTATTWLAYLINFLVSALLAIIIATGSYRVVEVPGRRLLRAVADRLLGSRSVSPSVSNEVRTTAAAG